MKLIFRCTPLAVLLCTLGGNVLTAQTLPPEKAVLPKISPAPITRSYTNNVIKGSGNKVSTFNTGKGVTYVQTQTSGPDNQVIVSHQGGKVIPVAPGSPEAQAMDLEFNKIMQNVDLQLKAMGINNPAPVLDPTLVPRMPNPVVSAPVTKPTPMTEPAPVTEPAPKTEPAPLPTAPNTPEPLAVNGPLPLSNPLYQPLPRVGIADVDQAMFNLENDLKLIGLQLQQLEAQLQTTTLSTPLLARPFPQAWVGMPAFQPLYTAQIPVTMPSLYLPNLSGLPQGPNIINETYPVTVPYGYANPYYNSNFIQGNSNMIYNLNR